MFVKKNYSFKEVWQFSGHHMIWLLVWAAMVAGLHELLDDNWINIPWLPLSIIATAVAFYIGFKNNSSYDRLWEARKIWGAIVNSSRAWGSAIKGFVTAQFATRDVSHDELQEIRQRLIYRHIAWLYALRSQLLLPTEWEHVSQGGHLSRHAQRFEREFGVGLVDDEVTKIELKNFLPPDEYERLINYKNTATQIIDQQAMDLRELRQDGIIEDFRHMELQQILYDFYVHQGKAERIKKFPFPRQYAGMSTIFVGVFIFLLPFGLVSEFAKLGENGEWLSIPFVALVGWVYIVMELVGDYSENPFQRMGNDIPMLALSRTIEIDLREMLGETDLPAPIKAKNSVLM